MVARGVMIARWLVDEDETETVYISLWMNEKEHQEVMTTSYAINSKECNSQKQLSLTPGLHLQLCKMLIKAAGKKIAISLMSQPIRSLHHSIRSMLFYF
jgi:hypothetical protein